MRSGGGRRAGPRQWIWSVCPSLGLAVRVARGYAACVGGGRWRVYGTQVAGVDDGTVEAVLGRRLAEGARDAPTGLMAEQKLVVPACPRRENGHLWRFDRERSTGDCQADVCQACGLVRLTSYRTGQVVRYAGSGACDGA